MGTLADTIIPLMGSVSMEKAETVRKACDGLEKRIEELERATTNTGEGARKADGAKPAQVPSPAPSASVPLTMTQRERETIIEEEQEFTLLAWTLQACWSVCNGVEASENATSQRKAIARLTMDALPKAREELARLLLASRAPRPTLNLRTATPESAPRASTVSVEEMAERLYEANRALPTWERNPSTCELTQKARDYFRSLARSALSALSASEERPRLSDRYRLCSKCAAPDAEEISVSESPRYLDLGCPVCKPSRAVDPLVVDAHSAELSDLDDRVSKLEQSPRYMDLGCSVCKPSRAAQPASEPRCKHGRSLYSAFDCIACEEEGSADHEAKRAAQLEYTVGCDQCEKPLSKVEHHPSGIIICKECGGDSTRAAQPAPASTPPARAVAGTSLVCTECGCRWKRHADGSFQLYDADQRPCVECDNAPNSPLRPETPDDAPASTPDEGEVETPVQPIVTDKHGVTRFKANAIVAYIVDWCARKNGTVGYGPDPDGPAPDLSEISRMAFSRDDRVQLAQLIGYSLSGFEELGYVESADVHRALRLSSSRPPRVDVRAVLQRFYGCPEGDMRLKGPWLADMTAALKSQGVECVGEKESAA